jgi:serine/threonine protein kinase/formylglycine-generating enzyme required for sulfatase activity
MQSNCPSRKRLADFLSGLGSDGEIEQVGGHLGQCEQCMAVVDQLSEFGHETVTVGTGSGFLKEPELARLKQQAKTLLASNRLEEPREVPTRIDHYEIIQRLGAGGFAVVYSARDTRDGSLVALKVLRKLPGERYDAEAITLQSLSHPFIVRVLNWGDHDEQSWYLAMQFVAGPSMADMLCAGPVEPLSAAKMIAQVARALHYAHTQGFVHRDIKPANILIDSQGNPKVSDFGLAIHDDDRWDHRDEVAGTLPYMSPEQIRRESHRLDGRTDIWSTGVVLYEMLTGKRPFRGEGTDQIQDEILHREPKPPRQIRDHVVPRLEQICLKCLAKAMSDRFQTALDLAEDLEAWIESHSASDHQESRQTHAILGNSAKPVIPKGLCSFDPDDVEFYLRLLPGPRDRNGIPESIRYWTSRIESRRSSKSFSVGVIYGRSGSGKSSFVKAGVLPLLGNEVLPIYIECSASGTDERLRQSLCDAFGFLLPTDSLIDSTRMCRQQGKHGKKVVLILDQFEQYLHGCRGRDDIRLADALRHCDGSNLQCLLIVRDDFWMEISDFMRRLEVPLVEGLNSYPIQPFPVQHAVSVLAEFGRSYGKLPAGPLADEQQSFLSSAVTSLASDGQVVCLGLALFAHLMKDRSWIPTTLSEVGGLEGLGVTFLEESFCSPNAADTHREHVEAACNVLSCLLPAANESIKGEMKTRSDLLRASGYESEPHKFEQLLKILDKDLRLVKPIAGQATSESVPAEPCYQLSHDYAVPSLRTWLLRRDLTTYRGRALVRLRTRDHYWRLRPENRQLPSFWETFSIWLATDRSRWTSSQRSMMRKAFTNHSARLIGLYLPILLIPLAILLWQSTSARLSRLSECGPEAIPAAIEDLRSRRLLARPALRSQVADVSLAAEKRLRAALALTSIGDNQTAAVVEQSVRVPSDYAPAIHESLRRDPNSRRTLTDSFSQRESIPSLTTEQVITALLAMNLGEWIPAERIAKNTENPIARTYFIDQFPDWFVKTEQVLDCLNQTDAPDLQSAICIGLGGLASKADRDLNPDDERRISQALARLVISTRHPATHSAAEYALRQWQVPVPHGPSQLADAAAQWIVTPSGLCLLNVPAGHLKWPVDGQLTEVEVPSFWLASQEVTLGLYESFLQEVGADGRASSTHVSPTNDRPANSLSWMDSIEFVNWLSEHEGLTPYYVRVNGTWTVPDLTGAGYRLPTEREWEYACRSGTQTHYFFGDDVEFLRDYATFGTSLMCAPCGSKPPNAWGFFDMSGNVWEWCHCDELCSQSNPLKQDAVMNGEFAVIRGGAYDNPAQSLRSDNRQGLKVHERWAGIGLRVARTRLGHLTLDASSR